MVKKIPRKSRKKNWEAIINERGAKLPNTEIDIWHIYIFDTIKVFDFEILNIQ